MSETTAQNDKRRCNKHGNCKSKPGWTILKKIETDCKWFLKTCQPKLSVVCSKQWFLQAGRYATKGEKPLRASVCFFDRTAVQRYGCLKASLGSRAFTYAYNCCFNASLLWIFSVSLDYLFLSTYFVKCRQNPNGVEFQGTIFKFKTEKKNKFRRCLFTLSIKRKMRHSKEMQK